MQYVYVHACVSINKARDTKSHYGISSVARESIFFILLRYEDYTRRSLRKRGSVCVESESRRDMFHEETSET